MEIDLHVTNNCNLSCKHCVYMSGDIKMKDITLNDVKFLSDSFKQMKVKEIHITGGEPLINSEIFDIIDYLHTEGFIVRIQTNGLLINANSAKRLKKCGISHILISIDGMKEAHNLLRTNQNSFDLAMQAIIICLKEKIFTRVNTVLHKDNLKDIENLLHITSKMGINQHSFFYLTPIGRGKNLIDKILTLKEWKAVKQHILSIANKLNFLGKVKVQDVFHEEEFLNHHCRIFRKDNCLIMSDGNIFPCVFFVHSKYKLGNIHENTLIDIWNDSTKWKQFFVKRKKNCINNKCSGGCRGLAYVLTGNFDVCDPRCDIEMGLIPSCIRSYVGGAAEL